MRKEVSEISKYVTCKEMSDEFDIEYVEIMESGIMPDLMIKHISLKESDFNIIKEKLVQKIISCSKETMFNMNKDLLNKSLDKASRFIAVNGQIGKGTHVMCSEELYNSHKEQFSKFEGTFFFVEGLKDIYVYRLNKAEQPGLLLAYNDDKYDIVEVGFFAERQFCKIELN